MSWTVPNEPKAVRRLVKKLEPEDPARCRCCYEAGPCGYTLQRQVTTTRSCDVVAPGIDSAEAGLVSRACANTRP